MLVLDGDSNDLRLQRAVNLLRAGYAKTVFLDERTDQVQFGRTQAEAAQNFIAYRHLESVEVCPGRMASTAEEVEFARAACSRCTPIGFCSSPPPITPAVLPFSATACRNMSGA